MSKVYFGDVVRDVKITVDRANNPFEYYVAGDHMDTEELRILRRGKFSEPPEPGPAFIRVFNSGQILYGSRRTYLKKIAVADFSGVCANTTFVLETKDEKVFLQRLLPFLMYSEKFTNFSVNNSKGSTNPYILFSDLAKFEFDLPSIVEQHKLADLLWAANAAREAYKKLLNLTDELVKSRFVEMFGDPATNPMGWPIKSLGDIADIFIGLTYKPSDISHNGIIVLRSGNIQNGEIILSDIVRVKTNIRERLLVQKNDILMCSRNGSAQLVGKTALISVLDESMTFGAFMTIIRSQYNKYLLSFFRSEAFFNQITSAKTSTINQITKSMLEEIFLPLPPLPLQNQFAEFVQQSDKSKFELQRTMDELDATYKSILRENLG